MAPAQIPVFLSQKPSTKSGIHRRICNFILSVVSRCGRGGAAASPADEGALPQAAYGCSRPGDTEEASPTNPYDDLDGLMGDLNLVRLRLSILQARVY